jgi:hypothetical protein
MVAAIMPGYRVISVVLIPHKGQTEGVFDLVLGPAP